MSEAEPAPISVVEIVLRKLMTESLGTCDPKSRGGTVILLKHQELKAYLSLNHTFVE